MKANQTSNATGVQIFHFENAHQVRANLINGEPWFVARDVCRALQLSNVSAAVNPLDADERAKFNLGRQGEGWIINESGLYCLILRSRDAMKPGTVQHKFRKWVTSEVLPSLRKTGSYSVDQSGEIERLKAEVQHATTRYNSYRAQMCRLRKRGEAIPRANALIAPVNTVTPAHQVNELLRDLCRVKRNIDLFYESDEGKVMQDIPEPYREVEDKLLGAITSLADYAGLMMVDRLLSDDRLLAATA